MKTLIMVVLVLMLFVAGLGFYRGWFTLSSHSRGTESNKVDINLTVDGDKVNEDAETVKEKTAELTGKATDGAKAFGDQVSDKVKSD
jgi:hypothetical protein